MSKTNSCFLIGNLGIDPVERARSENGPVVGFTVAENVQVYDKESRQYKTVHTNWFQVTAFGTLAERARGSLHKGDRVAIQGRMKVSKYSDRAGVERNSFELIADDIGTWHSLPGSAGQGSGRQSPSAAPDLDEAAPSPINEESLPF